MFATTQLSESQIAVMWGIGISVTTFLIAALTVGILALVQRKA